MVHKKVGTITLEYVNENGVVVSEAFMGEFNNAIFRGNISGMEGTFQGTLTVGAINAVKNLTIGGKATAVTTVSTLALANPQTHGFNDDEVFRTVHSLTFEVPTANFAGGWVTAGIQYRIDDQRQDNDMFRTEYRILIDGNVVFTSPQPSKFKWYYRNVQWFFHEVAAAVGSSGFHTITLQYKWYPAVTNVYPEFRDVTIRADYIRK